MTKKDLLIGSSGIIAVIVTRKIIQSIGIVNISLETKLILMYIIVIIYAIKSTRERNRIARKYLIASSVMFAALSILLSVFLIVQEGLPQVYQNIRVPLGTITVILFVLILVPVYGAYFAKRE